MVGHISSFYHGSGCVKTIMCYSILINNQCRFDAFERQLGKKTFNITYTTKYGIEYISKQFNHFYDPFLIYPTFIFLVVLLKSIYINVIVNSIKLRTKGI